MTLTQRSVNSITWITLANFLAYPIGLVQSIILARFLSVETFGVFVGIASIVNLSYVVFDFGLVNAFIHRSEESQDEKWAAGIIFTLRLILDTIWVIGLSLFGLFYLTGERQLVLFILVVAGYLTKITATPRAILIRRVQHRRLAILDLGISLFSALLSMLIAWQTRSVWALLVSSIVGLILGVAGLYFIKPVWRPHFAWSNPSARYFLSFGGKNLINSLLDSFLDNLDNLWTSNNLGDRQLGYYSRAFKFAIYPRMILALPLNTVLSGTFAELKHDRLRLSKAFFRSSVFLTRVGFLLAGGLSVIATEFIIIFLGDKWLPMLTAFRLLLVFSLLDPIRITVAGVLVAVGKPEKITLIRVIQVVIMASGLFTLGFLYQITGVALTMDMMVFVGVVLSLYLVRSHVDFSLPRLTIPPIIALAFGLSTTWIMMTRWELDLGWLSLLVKGTLFSAIYLGSLYLIEGKVLYQSFIEIIDISALVKQFKKKNKFGQLK